MVVIFPADRRDAIHSDRGQIAGYMHGIVNFAQREAIATIKFLRASGIDWQRSALWGDARGRGWLLLH